ncbi:uncharacterized protein LOC110744542 [Prunus avium]|uniref:Uncharacterized protein LOC110744542 n=1 Tax=Prunus avium TaxID=42229 RepID=A0A6P5R5G5_PRUAV|nr:uncharacterized protein LOC110744542 [Prunus avium]
MDIAGNIEIRRLLLIIGGVVVIVVVSQCSELPSVFANVSSSNNSKPSKSNVGVVVGLVVNDTDVSDSAPGGDSNSHKELMLEKNLTLDENFLEGTDRNADDISVQEKTLDFRNDSLQKTDKTDESYKADNGPKTSSGFNKIENAPIIRNNPGLSASVLRNLSKFIRSYDLMDHMLKVYIYKEGEKPVFHQPLMRGIYASEGWFMKLVEGNKKMSKMDLGGKPASERSILAFFVGGMHGYLRPILLHYWENKEPDIQCHVILKAKEFTGNT